MVEIKKSKKVILYFFLFSIIFINKSLADIYLTNCKTVEKKNETKSVSMVFSLNRNSVVINKVNNNKVKYKIQITQIHDKKNLIFDAKNNSYTLNFKPGFSYLKKNESFDVNNSSEINLVSKSLNGININCTKPKMIKKEQGKDLKEVKIDQKKIQEIMEKLKNNQGVQNQDLNKIMEQLNNSNSPTKIDASQLTELLKSKSFIGQLTSGNTVDKIKSEDFLKMIKSEFEKLINK